MTTMLERAARAVDPAIWEIDGPIPTRSDTLDFHARRKYSVEVARAVLAAVREPDVDGVFDSDPLAPWWYEGASRRDFTAMIDAILEGK